MTEAIIFICTVVGFVIAYLTYHNTYIKDPIEERKDLLHKFKFAKELNQSLITELTTYAIANNVMDEHFMQGLTFRTGINELEKVRTLLFNTENENLILNSKPSKRNMEDLFKNLDIQIKHHSEIQTVLNLHYK